MPEHRKPRKAQEDASEEEEALSDDAVSDEV